MGTINTYDNNNACVNASITQILYLCDLQTTNYVAGLWMMCE